MQRAGQKLPASSDVDSTSLSEARNSVTVRLFNEPAPESAEFDFAQRVDATQIAAQQNFLEVAIEERIRSRLQGRVRNLRVEVRDDVVILQGQCATYYTKQLAQHAAMGVLEDEHLENAIVVCVGQ